MNVGLYLQLVGEALLLNAHALESKAELFIGPRQLLLIPPSHLLSSVNWSKIAVPKWAQYSELSAMLGTLYWGPKSEIRAFTDSAKGYRSLGAGRGEARGPGGGPNTGFGVGASLDAVDASASGRLAVGWLGDCLAAFVALRATLSCFNQPFELHLRPEKSANLISDLDGGQVLEDGLLGGGLRLGPGGALVGLPGDELLRCPRRLPLHLRAALGGKRNCIELLCITSCHKAGNFVLSVIS